MESSMFTILFALGSAVIGIIYAAWLAFWVKGLDGGTPEMKMIQAAIHEGASAYMARQFKTVAVVAAIIFVLLWAAGAWSAHFGLLTACGFLVGGTASAISGYVGMMVAVRANAKTAQAAHNGLNAALQVAFRGGAVTGLLLISLGLMAVTGFYAIAINVTEESHAVSALLSLGLGGGLISLFARVGGGIYTKAADVGADLVGKVEAGIPEDDPRNAAVIADNVGDNVGDCAGMAADLFETYAVTIIATMLLGALMIKAPNASPNALIYPLAIGGFAIIASIIGTWFVRAKPGEKNVMPALYRGLWVAGILALIAFWPITQVMMGEIVAGVPFEVAGAMKFITIWHLGGAAAGGLALTGFMVWITEYYTGTQFKSVRHIAEASTTGHATNIIAGLGVSMKATAWPVIAGCFAILASYALAGLYGI